MALDSTNPLYAENIVDWQTMRHTYQGERVVKEQGEVYLPPTSGQVIDGMGLGQPGKVAYDAYKTRAVFPDYVSDGVESLIGMIHKKPAVIELPAAMEGMRESATVAGEGLQMLLRRITEQQLVPGRTGLLLDLPKTPNPANPLPYIALYWAESMINWDQDTKDDKDFLNLVVLDESGYVRVDEFKWEHVDQYRVLMLGEPLVNEAEGESGDGKVVYSQGVFDDNQFLQANMEVPTLRGTPLEEIPFVFINSTDIIPDTDNPPLLGLARLSLTIYRGEADYRQCLYMQGQETLVVIGGTKDEETRVGAGSKIDVDVGGDAKFVGVSAAGLSEQRIALENDRKHADSKSGSLISPGKTNQESGEALKTRLGAQTATLNDVAWAGASGLENILKVAATWLGLNPDEVSVTPNTDFVDIALNSKELVELVTARTLGAPLSLESIHAIMQERGMTELEFEDELAKIMEENANMPSGTGVDENFEGDDE